MDCSFPQQNLFLAMRRHLWKHPLEMQFNSQLNSFPCYFKCHVWSVIYSTSQMMQHLPAAGTFSYTQKEQGNISLFTTNLHQISFKYCESSYMIFWGRSVSLFLCIIPWVVLYSWLKTIKQLLSYTAHSQNNLTGNFPQLNIYTGIDNCGTSLLHVPHHLPPAILADNQKSGLSLHRLLLVFIPNPQYSSWIYRLVPFLSALKFPFMAARWLQLH